MITMAMHPSARPNFRNLFWNPFKMTLITVLRTFPFVGKWFTNGYHNRSAQEMMDPASKARNEGNPWNDVSGKAYTPDRAETDLLPTIWKPQTILYPYERLEDIEPWLFVPGQYNGRIGVIWETCTACKMCVNICPNDCLHMSTELRVDVLDNADGEFEDVRSDLEVGGWATMLDEEVVETQSTFDHVKDHAAPPEEWRFGEVIDVSGSTAKVRWNDTGDDEVVPADALRSASDQIVSGRIDIGRCMFCGLCMEACSFTSFFMTNEYDGMSGFTRQELWFDADRTRVLPSVHQEAVDAELAKRATKERNKRAKATAKAAKTEAEA